MLIGFVFLFFLVGNGHFPIEHNCMDASEYVSAHLCGCLVACLPSDPLWPALRVL